MTADEAGGTAGAPPPSASAAAAEGRDGLARSARGMAVGTVASRATGFLRTAVLAAVLGVQGVGLAYNLSNTLPNIVYELLLGGVLTSVVVPLLVHAARDGEEAGRAYAERLLSAVVLLLGAAAVVLVLLAPQIVDLYASDRLPEADRDLAVVLARFFLPQVLFYGAGAVLGALLNVRGRFAAPMWAPVLNNVVVISTGLLFLLVPGGEPLTSASLTDAQITLLGVGTTLGIVAQTVALVPALRASGGLPRLRLDLRGSGLLRAGRLAGWVLLYVAGNQLAYLVVVRLATGAPPGRSYASYVYAFVLWQLPHAVVAVSVITALLPRMSRAAADGRLGDLRGALSQGLRLTVAVMVPAAAAYALLGRDVGVLVFAHGETSVEEARFIGVLLSVFAAGLVPFSTYQLQLRAFHAQQDTRTPAVVNLAVNATAIAVDLVLVVLLPRDVLVVGLAAGHASSYLVGLLVCARLLSGRIGGVEGALVVRTAARCAVATAVAVGAAAVVAALVRDAVASSLGAGPAASAAVLAAAGLVLGIGYALLARRLRVPEVEQAVGPVLRRLGRR